MTFESRVRALALQNRHMSLGEALSIMDREDGVASPFSCPPATASIQQRAAWVLDQRLIMDYLPEHDKNSYKKINAIKECRGISNWGLKEAKDAVEYAITMRDAGWVNTQEKERLEVESQEAIASINQTIQAMQAGAASAGVTLVP